MKSINIYYFKLAKKLNHEFHDKLVKEKIHFRGNQNSLSIISVNKETAEKGKSNIKTEANAIKLLREGLNLEMPKRKTPEKELQAWIINYSMINNGKLPFGKNITYLTSEIALNIDNKKIVNDILAIDSEGKMCIIELKNKRDNYVKEQTINFEVFVKSEEPFFNELLSAISPIKWNGDIRKISVWPKVKVKAKENKYNYVEEINYTYNEEVNEYTFE